MVGDVMAFEQAGLMAAADPELAGGLGTYAWVFAQGVLLDFTPCVFPLIPITIAVFGGKGVSKARALFLASAYVLGLATLYTGLGVLASLTSAKFGTWLADPIVVFPIVILLGALAASMFGAFDLQLPSAWQTKLSQVGGAGPLGAYLMGLVSGLIMAPCTGPVLLSILAIVAVGGGGDGGILYGGSLLFVHALGIGTIFFVFAFGVSLWRPGAWMEYVKSFFGVMLLIMGFWFLRPLSHDIRGLGLVADWGLVLGVAVMAAGIALGAIHRSFHGSTRERLIKGAAVAVTVGGGALAVNNFFHVELKADWKTVATVAQMEEAITRADAENKPLLVDFGAEWCLPCKELEKLVFSKPEVEAELGAYELIKVDATDPDDPEATTMQNAFHGQNLPNIVVYSPGSGLADHFEDLRAGQPLPQPTVHIKKVISAEEFLVLLDDVR
jgi:thiol:disulfide interchange protein DsbD